MAIIRFFFIDRIRFHSTRECALLNYFYIDYKTINTHVSIDGGKFQRASTPVIKYESRKYEMLVPITINIRNEKHFSNRTGNKINITHVLLQTK